MPIGIPNFTEAFGESARGEHIVTIDDIIIDGATRAEKGGGWNAPSQRVERGFDFSSYSDAEPISATLEAWVDQSTLDALESLRGRTQPFSATLDNLGLPEAKLNDLRVENEASRLLQFQITLEIEEVRVAETETEEIVFESEGDSLSSNAETATPSIAASNVEDDPFAESEGGGVADSLEAASDALAGVVFGG